MFKRKYFDDFPWDNSENGIYMFNDLNIRGNIDVLIIDGKYKIHNGSLDICKQSEHTTRRLRNQYWRGE